MKLQGKEVSAYEAEYRNITERLMREMPPFKEAEQLLELVQMHFSLAARRAQRPKVMILGSGLPEELVLAFGITPCWVLGGSLQTCDLPQWTELLARLNDKELLKNNLCRTVLAYIAIQDECKPKCISYLRTVPKIEASHIYKPAHASGNILLMGSPVYFPNYKIPFLLQDTLWCWSWASARAISLSKRR